MSKLKVGDSFKLEFKVVSTIPESPYYGLRGADTTISIHKDAIDRCATHVIPAPEHFNVGDIVRFKPAYGETDVDWKIVHIEDPAIILYKREGSLFDSNVVITKPHNITKKPNDLS